MQLLRATRRTNHAVVFINVEAITVVEEQSTESDGYTAIILQNGREIDVSETIDQLLRYPNRHVIEL